MGPSSKHKKMFSAQDIERYHAGLLSTGEMHALEKAALEDPFLADALEGYAHTATPKQDLDQLRKRLLEKSRNKKSILYIFNSPAFKIAALILILLGSGWIIYNGMNNSKHSIALEKPHEAAKAKVDTVTIQRETISNSNAPVANAKTNADKDNKITAAPGYSTSKEQIPAASSTTLRKEATEKEAAVPPIDLNETAASKKNIIEDRYSSTVQATSDSTSLASGNKIDLRTQSDMFKSRSLASSSKPISNKSGDTIQNLNVTLKPLPDSQQPEVVVVGYGVQKKIGPRPITIIDSLEPKEGWSSYNDYVLSNLKSPEDLNMKPISGEVELSFDINKEGEPVNIAIVKSLCDKCDDEAIRLLKQGPKWKKNKKGKGKIAIKF